MKNCIPIMAADYQEVIESVEKAELMNCQLIEWRLDALNGRVDMEKVINTWRYIKAKTRKQIIMTFRTERHGGLRDMDPSTYVWMIRRIVELVTPDYVDIEMDNCGGDAQLKMLTGIARNKGVKVIISYHDMLYTESAREIYMRILHMKYLGADLPKVAYNAREKSNVDALIEGAKKAYEETGPLIAISMGELGKVTRTDGDSFGSQINFIKPMGSKAPRAVNTGQLDYNQSFTK